MALSLPPLLQVQMSLSAEQHASACGAGWHRLCGSQQVRFPQLVLSSALSAAIMRCRRQKSDGAIAGRPIVGNLSSRQGPADGSPNRFSQPRRGSLDPPPTAPRTPRRDPGRSERTGWNAS